LVDSFECVKMHGPTNPRHGYSDLVNTLDQNNIICKCHPYLAIWSSTLHGLGCSVTDLY